MEGGVFFLSKELDPSSDANHQRHRVTLAHFIASSKLFDIWRCQISSEWDYTFFSNGHHTYSWIDFCLLQIFASKGHQVRHTLYHLVWPCSDFHQEIHTEWHTLSQPEHKSQILMSFKEFFFTSMHQTPVEGWWTSEHSLLLTLDAEKAFDRVHWGYLFRALNKIWPTLPNANSYKQLSLPYSRPPQHMFSRKGCFSKTSKYQMGQDRDPPVSTDLCSLNGALGEKN